MRKMKQWGLSITRSIRERKRLFLLLIVGQLLVLFAMGWVTVTHVNTIVEKTQSVLSQVDQANFDPEKIDAGQPFLNSLAPIYESYQIMKENIIRWLIWLLIICSGGNGLLWLGSHALVAKKSSESGQKSRWHTLLRLWLHFVLLTVGFFLSSVILFVLLVQSSFFNDPDQERLIFRIKMAFALIGFLYYFFLCFAAQMNAPSWKSLFNSGCKAGMQRGYYSLPLLAILGGAILAAGYLLQLALEESASFILLFLATILFTSMIVIARLVWISAQHELSSAPKAGETH